MFATTAVRFLRCGRCRNATRLRAARNARVCRRALFWGRRTFSACRQTGERRTLPTSVARTRPGHSKSTRRRMVPVAAAVPASRHDWLRKHEAVRKAFQRRGRGWSATDGDKRTNLPRKAKPPPFDQRGLVGWMARGEEWASSVSPQGPYSYPTEVRAFQQVHNLGNVDDFKNLPHLIRVLMKRA